jgi:putative DNA modification/repair radical SAM protein
VGTAKGSSEGTTDIRRKLTVLADAAKYDASCASSGSKRTRMEGGLGNATGMGICHSYTPDGRCVSLLKVLLTNVCIYDCQYCVNRISSDIERATFQPAELAQLVVDFYRRNYIEGLFLSSGVWRSPDATLERMIEVARLLREEHKFGGYIHLKIIPNASPELVERAGALADRLSANIELPTERDLERLAPEKKIADVDRSMAIVKVRSDEAAHERKRFRNAPRFAPAGQSTQMIVGATSTTDGEVLHQTSRLYSVHRLRRVYYSAYSPIPRADPRLPSKPIGAVREHRLYQADWLLRFYGFTVGELLTPGQNLDPALDPKTAWALENRATFPINVERASRESLLRIPGMGVRSVDRILRARRLGRIRLEDLARLGVAMTRARWFVVTADHNPSLVHIDSSKLRSQLAPEPKQLTLFA